MTLSEHINTPQIERRARGRHVPYLCTLRLCRPTGATCAICHRVIYPANWISVQRVSL